VDQSSPDFFRRTREESLSISTFSDFGYWTRSGDIRDRILKLYEIARNFVCFGPDFFGGRAPEFFDFRYKVHLGCDHVAKSHSNRPRELGDLASKIIKKEKKEEKTSAVKYKAFRNYRSGRPNKHLSHFSNFANKH